MNTLYPLNYLEILLTKENNQVTYTSSHMHQYYKHKVEKKNKIEIEKKIYWQNHVYLKVDLCLKRWHRG